MGAVAELREDPDAVVPPWFRRQMARLMGLRFCPSRLITHWSALQSFTESQVAFAVEGVLGRNFDSFPAPWVFRQFAEQARARELGTGVDRGVDLPAPRLIGELPDGTKLYQHREWRYYCVVCSDSGWQTKDCDVVPCGRPFDHATHPYVVPCACVTSNPDVQRKRARMAQSGGQGATE